MCARIPRLAACYLSQPRLNRALFRLNGVLDRLANKRTSNTYWPSSPKATASLSGFFGGGVWEGGGGGGGGGGERERHEAVNQVLFRLTRLLFRQARMARMTLGLTLFCLTSN